MAYQSKTWSLSDEVVAAVEAAREHHGLSPNQLLKRILIDLKGTPLEQWKREDFKLMLTIMKESEPETYERVVETVLSLAAPLREWHTEEGIKKFVHEMKETDGAMRILARMATYSGNTSKDATFEFAHTEPPAHLDATGPELSSGKGKATVETRGIRPKGDAKR